MLHGRIVRPRGQGAYPYNSNVPVSVDANSIAHIPGAQVVQVEQLPRRRRAEGVRRDPGGGAAEGRRGTTNRDPARHGQPLEALRGVRQRRARSPAPDRSADTGNVDAALAVGGAHGVGHASSTTTRATCRSARAARSPTSRRTGRRSGATRRTSTASSPTWRTCSRRSRRTRSACIFYEGSSSFGNGCVAFDTAESAAIMSKAVGKPVRLQLMRWDEHGWTHYGPAILYDMRAGVDANGNIVAVRGDRLRPGRHVALHRPRARRARSARRRRRRTRSRRKVDGGGAITENLLAVDEGVEHELQADQQADRLDDGHLPQRRRCGPRAHSRRRSPTRRSIDMLAVAAGHGLARVPAPEHEHRPATDQRWAAVLQAAATAAELEAVGLRLEPEQGEHRHGPRHRQQPSRRRLRGRRRRHPGEQEDRQDPASRTSTRRRTPASR